MRDVSKGEACPTDSDFIADQDRATIAKSSTLPHDTAPRVTSPATVEGTQEVEINKLKARVKILKDNQGVIGARSADDAPIKGRRIDEEEGTTGRVSSDTEEIRVDEGEVAVERTSKYTKEMATVLTSMDAATVLASGTAKEIPTGSGSIPTAGVEVPTGSDMVPTAIPVFATATVVTPYSRRKGKEVMYQENYAKIYKFHSQQRRSWTKKQKRDYYMAVIRNNLGRKVKDFKGMTFEEVEAKFNFVYKQMEDFIPMGSKEEAKRYKRKAIRPASSDKEMELWVKLKRLYEPGPKDQLWAQTQNFMHAPIEWKLYDLSEVHHVTTKDKEIFMLVEKDYPLRKGLALVMIYYKLQVENSSQMANDLVLKIYKIVNSPLHASREGLSSEEGSSPCNDLLQASSGEFFTDGK
nr:hypothetical protein [Tanacetum cinerariifolium]